MPNSINFDVPKIGQKRFCCYFVLVNWYVRYEDLWIKNFSISKDRRLNPSTYGL